MLKFMWQIQSREGHSDFPFLVKWGPCYMLALAWQAPRYVTRSSRTVYWTFDITKYHSWSEFLLLYQGFFKINMCRLTVSWKKASPLVLKLEEPRRNFNCKNQYKLGVTGDRQKRVGQESRRSEEQGRKKKNRECVNIAPWRNKGKMMFLQGDHHSVQPVILHISRRKTLVSPGSNIPEKGDKEMRWKERERNGKCQISAKVEIIRRS